MSNSNVVLYQVRVMFKFAGKDVVNFKILTDTEAGIKQFIDYLSKLGGIERISVEYLCEYNCDLLGSLHNISNIGGEKNEEI